MEEHEIPSVALTESVRINGVPYSATLSTTGDLTWRSAASFAGERRLSLEKEVLGIELRGSILAVRSFVEEIKEASCVGLGKREVKRVRRDYVFELENDEKGMIWGDRLSICLNNLGRPKRLFIIVNPFGGKRNAIKIFITEVKPLLQAANILYTIQETNYQLHAQEIMSSLDLRKFDGIVCVSGDGILVEIVNGLLKREDWRAAIKIPLGIIPAGTGNGMVKSLLHAAGDPYSISNAVFSIIRGHKRALDVTSVLQGDTKFFSVLMLTWGLIADIDIESEKYRWMGSARLEFYSLLRVLRLRKYNGSVQFIPAPGFESFGQPVDHNTTPVQALNAAPGDNTPVQALNAAPGDQALNAEPVGPTQWRSIEGPFVYVWLNNVPWCSQDTMPAPQAQFSDGYLDVVIVKECPVSVLLSLMLQMGDGSYINSPYVIYMKVKAFRLTPGQRVGNPRKGGIIDSDGEVLARGDLNLNSNSNSNSNSGLEKERKYLMDYGSPIHMSVEQGLATIFAPS